MKNYNEIAESIFERRDKYIAERTKKKKLFLRTGTAACVLAFVLLAGAGILKNGFANYNQPLTSTDTSKSNKQNSISHSEANTYETVEKVVSNCLSEAPCNDTDTDDPDDNAGHDVTMISSYGGDVSQSYASPENGKVHYSVPLESAMEEYGDSVLYQVFIDVFSNNEPLDADSQQVKAEADRLADEGYIVAYETYFDGERNHYYFTIHAKFDQIKQFMGNEKYGYMLFLYDERV